MTNSPLVPLATFVAALVAAGAALLANWLSARTSLHTAHSQPRIEAVSMFLDAVDVMLAERPSRGDMEAVSSALLRIQLFFTEKPVAIADRMHATARQVLENVPRPGPGPDEVILTMVRELAEKEERVLEADRDDEEDPAEARDLLELLLRWRREADEWHAQRRPEPDLKERAHDLRGRVLVDFDEHAELLEYDDVRTVLGSGRERAERRQRAELFGVLQGELRGDRKELVNAVAVWLESPPRRH
ncbi:hypothetical protein [Streptomyces sp. NPDC058665]|uniref:hypothetical protein n=1 Tax=Streptomyces sp. NPDC058665 TaxID=3346586 RepID=UPI003659F376